MAKTTLKKILSCTYCKPVIVLVTKHLSVHKLLKRKIKLAKRKFWKTVHLFMSLITQWL